MVSRSSILSLLTVALAAIPGYSFALQSQNPPATPCPATDSTEKTTQPGSADQTAAKKTDKSSAPCVSAPAPKEPPAAQRFPFPGESPAPQPPGSSSSTPDAPAQSGHQPSAAEEHPFPGSAPPMPGSSDSSSSSSSSSSDS